MDNIKRNAGQKSENKKAPSNSKFKSVLKLIFVHNIGYKVLALVTGVAIWVLTVGLGG